MHTCLHLNMHPKLTHFFLIQSNACFCEVCCVHLIQENFIPTPHYRLSPKMTPGGWFFPPHTKKMQLLYAPLNKVWLNFAPHSHVLGRNEKWACQLPIFGLKLVNTQNPLFKPDFRYSISNKMCSEWR